MDLAFLFWCSCFEELKNYVKLIRIFWVTFYRLLLPSLQSYMTPDLWQLMSSLWKAICLWAVCFVAFKAINMLNIINPYRILSLFSQQEHCTLEKWSEGNYGYFLLNIIKEINGFDFKINTLKIVWLFTGC